MSIHDCNHEKLAFMLIQHGGGIFPDVLIPELVCTDCHLNITCAPLSEIDSRFGNFKPELYGLTIPEETVQELYKWANDWEDKNWVPVNILISDPQTAYSEADKFLGMDQIKIADKALLDNQSYSV